MLPPALRVAMPRREPGRCRHVRDGPTCGLGDTGVMAARLYCCRGVAMAEELLSAAQSTAEVEEIELEEIEESSEIATGEFARAMLPTQSSSGRLTAPPPAGTRTSVPPPLPPQAREVRRSSMP